MLSVPDPVNLAELAVLTGMGGFLNGVKVHLFKTAVAPSRASVLADFVEADFTGYAASAVVTWGAPVLDSAGIPSVVGPTVQFVGGSSFAVSNVIYGYYVTTGDGTGLIYAEAFPAPLTIAATGQAVILVPKFQLVSQA